MADKSSIHWTDATWNPVTGCSHVSDGCRNCYAEALSLRYGWSKKPWTAANAAENVVLHPERLDVPLHWRKPRMIFVNSMSDLFHEQIPDEFIARVFFTMLRTPQHTFQVLTKRPDRMQQWRRDFWPMWSSNLSAAYLGKQLSLNNVWLGVSVENQRAADERIPLLLDTPAAVRFLSCEPLLGPVTLRPWLQLGWVCEMCYRRETSPQLPDGWTFVWQSAVCPECYPRLLNDGGYRVVLGGAYATSPDPRPWRPGLHWLIAGGESGPKHRPMDLDWARSLRDQCIAAGVPFFYKQGGGLRPGMHRELDGRLWEEMPIGEGGAHA